MVKLRLGHAARQRPLPHLTLTTEAPTATATTRLDRVRSLVSARSAAVLTRGVSGPDVEACAGPALSISESILVTTGWDEVSRGPVGTVVVRGTTGPVVALVRLQDEGHLRAGRALVLVLPSPAAAVDLDGATLAGALAGAAPSGVVQLSVA